MRRLYVNSKLLCAGGPSERLIHCPVVSVTQGEYADCDGEYRVTNITLSWDTSHPVYRHITITKDRFIFWVGGELGWVIGKQEYLHTGDAFHYSNNNNIAEISC